jgi:hypothetical protein
MYKKIFILVALLPFVIIIFNLDYEYKNTRKHDSMNRRISTTNHTSLSKKNIYIKEAISNTIKNNTYPNIGQVALEMNNLESKYLLPYDWGGDIKDFQKGLDCTGFIHGMMYYLGYNDYLKRFNTYSIYKKLLKDKDYTLIYQSKISSIKGYDLSKLQVGDIIIWPSGVNDFKNLPVVNTFGHIGVVSVVKNNIPYVTHFVRSHAYNDLDIFQHKGSGINTLKAKTFITLKQRGILNIFRKKNNV